jgi:hypothetical protein
MLGRRELNRMFDKLITEQIALTKDANNAYDTGEIVRTIQARFHQLSAITAEIFNRCKSGGTITISENLTQAISEVLPLLAFSDPDMQIQKHVERFDERHKLKPSFGQRHIQTEFSLYSLDAVLVLGERRRVRMPEASRLQCQEAWEYSRVEHDRLIRTISQARDQFDEYYESRLNVWPPKYSTLHEVELHIFGWHPSLPDEEEADENE